MKLHRIESFFIHQEYLAPAVLSCMSATRKADARHSFAPFDCLHGKPALGCPKQMSDARHGSVLRRAGLAHATADVRAVVHALEANFCGGSICAGQSALQARRGRRYTKNPAAAGDDHVALPLRASMQNFHTGTLLGSG